MYFIRIVKEKKWMTDTAEPYIEHNRKNFWIVLSVYISIFINSIVFFKEPFEFYLGYLIYIVLLPGFIFRFGFNKNLFFIFLILFVFGVINILSGYNTSSQFFKVFTGLFLSYFFYYYIIHEIDRDVEQLFKWYMIGAYIAAVIGLIQLFSYQIHFVPGYNFRWILNKWGLAPGGFWGLRINSIFAEPTHLGATLAPAFFVSVYNLLRKEVTFISKPKCIVIVVVYLLSFSGLGQLGIFLTLFLLAISFGFVRYVVFAIPLSFALFGYLYNNVAEFHERYDGLVGLFSGQEYILGQTHGSSFILYNNYTVAIRNFIANPIFGGGIGSHLIAFEKYSLAKDVVVAGINSNGQDANSMFLRLLSETGLFGVGIFIILLIKCYVKRDANHLTFHWLVSNGILIMILLNLFRQGHYFLNGFPFFVILYYYNAVSYKEYKNLHQN
jgi:hypothetical protein